MGDIIVLTIIAASVLLSVRSMRNDRKKGGCAGCSGCRHAANCPGRMAKESLQKSTGSSI